MRCTVRFSDVPAAHLCTCYQMSTRTNPPAKKSAGKRFRATATAHTTAKATRETAVIRLSPALKKRLNMKLAEEGRKF